MKVSKLKQRNILKYQYKIHKYKQAMKHRDWLNDHMKDCLTKILNTPEKVPHNDKAFLLTKVVYRRGWLWIKNRWNHNFKWSKYRKLQRANKPVRLIKEGL